MSDIETALRRAASGLPADAPDLSARAEEEGLVDVAYASVDSPLGPLLVASTPKGLVRLAYSEFRSPDEVLEDLAGRISPRVLEAPARLDPVRRELDEYFDGARHDFDVPIDWSHLAGFTRAVLRETARIRFGDTSTYAAVAERRREPACGARRRERARRQPDARGGALPPGAAHGRRPRRLHRRGRAQGVPAASRGRSALAAARRPRQEAGGAPHVLGVAGPPFADVPLEQRGARYPHQQHGHHERPDHRPPGAAGRQDHEP